MTEQTEGYPVKQAGSEVSKYSPTGLAAYEDGTELADMWDDPDYAEEFEAEEKAESGDLLDDAEKQIMADRHEPFTVTDIGDDKLGQFGKSYWPIKLILQSGQERMMFMSVHEQRANAIIAIQHRIRKSGKPVKNVMLKSSFVSQGNTFFVLRPWDGQIHTGLGADARPVNRIDETGQQAHAAGMPAPVDNPQPVQGQNIADEAPGVGSVASPDKV